MIYAIIAAAVILVIAFVVGFVKGFTKTKTWATEYLFAVILSVLIYSLADLSGMKGWVAAVLKIGTAVVFILVFAILSSRGKALLKKGIVAAQKRSYYEQYGDREENTLQILDAIESGDKKAYRQLTKRKFKEKRGGAGVADRICGAVTLMIKAVVVFGLIAVILLVVYQFSQLNTVKNQNFAAVNDFVNSIYSSGLWKFISKFVMDAFVIGILFFAIRCGFRSGIASVAWVLAVLALICGAAYISYGLFFNVDPFIATAQSLADGALKDIAQKIADTVNSFGIAKEPITALMIAQGVLGTAMFLVLFIVLLIVGIVVAGIIGRAREGKTFGVVDGVLGAIVAFAIAGAVMLFVGAILWTMQDLPFMETFNSYMYYTSSKGIVKPAAIASVFYTNNPLNGLEFIAKLPVRGWFA